MNTMIRETKERKELGIIDPKTGMNWINDLIGNWNGFDDGQFEYDEELEVYVCSQETFDWWENFTKEYEKADFTVFEYKQELTDNEEQLFNELLHDYCNTDLEKMPEAMLSTIESFEAGECYSVGYIDENGEYVESLNKQTRKKAYKVVAEWSKNDDTDFIITRY